MKVLALIFYFVLAAGFAPFKAAAQSIASPRLENLESCLEGFSDCNYARLHPQERQAVPSLLPTCEVRPGPESRRSSPLLAEAVSS
jgi:hypothetical protein